MNISLKVKNIVLVGVFNPSTFDKYFFIKNNIVKEDEILPNSIFGEIGIVQLLSQNFHVMINLNQIIVSSLKPENDTNEISKITLSILKTGKISNLSAMGINAQWFLDDNSKKMEELSKGFFYNEKLELFTKFFNADNSRFGVYASTNFKDSRLKLDIKPSIIQDILKTTIQDVILFAFNFHFDFKDDIENIKLISYLNDYNSYIEESKRIISIYR
jgi:hypothetical protein